MNDLKRINSALISVFDKSNLKPIIEKLEKILHQERKKVIDKELSPMTIEEFNSLIDSAESDSRNDRMYNAGEILKDIDTWK